MSCTLNGFAIKFADTELIFLFSCVYVCLYVYVWCVVYLSVQVCLPSKAHVEARGWFQVVFFTHCFTLNFEVGSRLGTWSMPLQLGWPVSARLLLCLPSARTVDVQHHAEVTHSCLWLQLQCIGCIWPPWAPALVCINPHVHIIKKNKSKSLKNVECRLERWLSLKMLATLPGRFYSIAPTVRGLEGSIILIPGRSQALFWSLLAYHTYTHK